MICRLQRFYRIEMTAAHDLSPVLPQMLSDSYGECQHVCDIAVIVSYFGSDGFRKVVDGHLRLKAARKLGITEIPVILCDEWTPAQVKAFRRMVNRSVTWADWDEELLALELQEIQKSDFDLSLTRAII